MVAGDWGSSKILTSEFYGCRGADNWKEMRYKFIKEQQHTIREYGNKIILKSKS